LSKSSRSKVRISKLWVKKEIAYGIIRNSTNTLPNPNLTLPQPLYNSFVHNLTLLGPTGLGILDAIGKKLKMPQNDQNKI
jgi:hypothetical protein